MSFGEPVPDATGELRLQLMQAQDQREAFRALGHRDVLAVIREALATDLSETCDKLRAEITRMEGENHRLRAEVERLRKAGDAMAEQIYNEGKVRGVAFISNVNEWNAAKEGKPSV